MSIEEGEEIQTKGTDNLFKGIIAEDVLNLEKESHPVAGSSRTPNPQDQNRNSPDTS
jgi:hypothetical protein